MINFDANPEDRRLILTIVDRAAKIYRKAGGKRYHKLSAEMDLTATHLNGCPLDLPRLSEADDFNIAHDVFGIARNLNRETGKLERFFLPRFAAKEA